MPVGSGMFSLLPLMSWGTKRWRKVSPISVGCCSLLHTAVWSQRDAVSDCPHYPKLNEIFHDQRRLKWCQPTADTPEDFKELQWMGDKIQFFLKPSTQLNHVGIFLTGVLSRLSIYFTVYCSTCIQKSQFQFKLHKMHLLGIHSECSEN